MVHEFLPLYGVFIMYGLIALLMYELGYVVGRWYQKRTPEEKEGPTGMIVGSILALLAFMLAFTMSMATDRFDTRRALVMEEANAIGTTWLRAGYLPEPAASRSRELLGEFAVLRVAPKGVVLEDAIVRVQEGREKLNELWAIAEELARNEPDSPLLALYVDTLNETIDQEALRTNAGVNVRVPSTVLSLLFYGSALTIGVVGLSAGLTGRRSLLTALVLIIVLGGVITLIIDIDRPQEGTLTAPQGPMIELVNQIGPPAD